METLNEALKIAALDIAQAAGEQLESDEEEDGLEEFDEEPIQAEKPAKVVKGTAKAPTTIFVSEDGSYRVNKDKGR